MLSRARSAVRLALSSVRSAFGDEHAWETTIGAFEAEDRRSPPPPSPIVFTGSSSITFWETLARDMAPLTVVNRGFGGSRIGEVVRYAPRIVLPYVPRAVVLFAGTNDIAPPRPASAEHVHARFLELARVVHDALPSVPLYYVGITPTPLRWKLWPIAREANARIEAETRRDSRLRYIDLERAFLTPEGVPNRALYRFDGLHPNARGYERWTEAIRPRLLEEVGAR